jgi:enamine deaminase RidA (YjgF/YER057c/UK114 family)
MTWRTFVAAVVAACAVGLANCPAAEDKPQETSIQYLALGAPEGTSQAVVVDGLPLVFTRQLLPLDREGKIVGEDSVDQQIEQVLANLETVLGASGSGMGKLVRVNVYALAPTTVDRFRELLGKRVDAAARPVISPVLTPLGHRKAQVAIDAIAVSEEKGDAVALKKSDAIAGDKDGAVAAVMPPGGVAYLSGVSAEGGVTTSAVAKAIATLERTLGQLKLSLAQVAHVKVFLRPATSADDVLVELKRLFPGQATPPVTFVEWLAPMPVEIELIAYLPPADQAAKSLSYYTPPDVRPSPFFSRVALVRSPRQIFIAGLYSRAKGRPDDQARDVFEQLKAILDQTGSDMLHLAKASYYASDDDSARALDRVRLQLFDQNCPPAASKVTIHGAGQAERTLTLDMIAIGKDK